MEKQIEANTPCYICPTGYICPICLTHVENSATLSCEHVFCSTCIEEWKQRANTCPVCRECINDKDELRTNLEAVDFLRNIISIDENNDIVRFAADADDDNANTINAEIQRRLRTIEYLRNVNNIDQSANNNNAEIFMHLGMVEYLQSINGVFVTNWPSQTGADDVSDQYGWY